MDNKEILNDVPRSGNYNVEPMQNPQTGKETSISEKLDEIADRMDELKKLSYSLSQRLFDKAMPQGENEGVNCISEMVKYIEDEQKETEDILNYVNRRL